MPLENVEDRPSRLLVLGAGLDQCFMLRRARSMGVETIAMDRDPEAPGFALADDSATVSNRDVSAIVAYVESRGIAVDGVATMGSDIPHVVAAVATRLGVPTIPIEAARVAVDKFAMKECFSAAGIPVPDYRLIDSSAALGRALDEWSRVVVKPLDQAGSRGVSLVASQRDVGRALSQAQKYSNGGSVLVERFLPGDQLSSESLVLDGAIVTPGLADRNYDELERFLPQIMENGGWVPSRHASERPTIDRLVSDCALSLGIRNGVIKGDLVRVGPGRYAVIEVAARLSGGDFSESLVPLSSGVNYVDQVIRQALGLPVERAALEPTRSACVANRYFFAAPGTLSSVDGVDAIASEAWIHKLEIWFEPGQTIPPLEGHGQRAGVFVVSGPDRETVARRIAAVYAAVDFCVESPSKPGPVLGSSPALRTLHGGIA